jgi:glyoxylase-like metal-dependent hydrolase (beta-lactamase superfamily II)
VTAIRTPGKVNEHTTLIDAGLYGVAGTCSLYLVRGGQTCLIDTGAASESSRVIKALRTLDAYPPDRIVLTHAHYDHCQGVPGLRKGTSRDIEVLAGRDSIPLLEDQSWNDVFHVRRGLTDVRDVHPVAQGDVIDLDGLTLRVIETPGHIPGHIALLDETNGNLFSGDALGSKFGDRAFTPPFIPPYWDREAYEATVQRLRTVDFDSVSLGHYGCIQGEEVRQLLDESQRTCEGWWRVFERVEREGKLDDADHLTSVIIEEMGMEPPDLVIERTGLRMLLGLVNLSRSITRRPPLTSGALLLPEVVKMLVNGFRYSRGT